MDDFEFVILGGGAGAKLIWGSVGDLSVAVVEESRVGGACPFVACVPSKAMLHTARVWQLAADPAQSALFTGRVPDEPAYQLACQWRDAIVHHRDDTLNAQALQNTGAVLIRGRGVLRGPGVLDVAGRTVRYRELVINTGSTAVRPDLPGIDTVSAWTSDDAMTTTTLPSSLVILGGGAVGCELAFLFATFGAAVTLIQRSDRLLPGEEPRASATVAESLVELGVVVLTGVTATAVSQHGDGTEVRLSSGHSVTAEKLVIATGRAPRVTGIGLDSVGLDVASGRPIPVDEHCRVVGADHLWAIGDATGKAQFTHTAHYQGRVVAANLRGNPVRADYTAIPRAVYVEPTLASVGHTVATARAAGIDPLVASADMRTAAVRATTDGSPRGWATILVDPATRTLVGATGMGQAAEEWMSLVALAIRAKIPVDQVADVVHPFPSFGELLENPLWELLDRTTGPTTESGMQWAGRT